MLNIYVGWDSREDVAYRVCENSIRRRASVPVNVVPLKHRELRENGLFWRQWQIDADTGNFRDGVDGRPFSTEFSHTRFLIPAIQDYQGWALFMDCDMIVLEDIANLFALADDKYAVMCRKHNHVPSTEVKMDNREQSQYGRKNWSSFMLINCAHPANKNLTLELVNTEDGRVLHQFGWLGDNNDALIGDLPVKYNWIEGTSPAVEGKPAVIHYTEGGPWFIDNPKCHEVLFADLWVREYERYLNESDIFQMVNDEVYAYRRDLKA